MKAPGPLVLDPVPRIPEVRAGDDVGTLLGDALAAAGLHLRSGDVVVVASKLCAKAAGRRVPAATRAAAVLAESSAVLVERLGGSGVNRIVRTRGGPTLAGAGIDASNAGPEQDGTVLLLPADADADAAALRVSLGARFRADVGVVVADTSGRAWRRGQIDYALGCAGLAAVDDLRGTLDADGRLLHSTVRAVADEIASAADLLKGKTTRVGAVRVRGLPAHGAPGAPQTAAALLRHEDEDWFGLGATEAIRDALGVRPGTQAAVDVGLVPVVPDELSARIGRAVALALLPTAGREPLPPWHPRTSRVAAETGLERVRADVIQSGVRLEAPEEFALGLAVARLLPALRSEGLQGRIGPRGTAPPHAVVLLI